PAGQGEFLESPEVIAFSMVVNERLGEVRFTQIRRESERSFHGSLSQLQPRRGSIDVPVKVVVRDGPPAIGEREIRIARDRFIEQTHGLEQGLLPILAVVEVFDQFLRLKIQIEDANILG